MMSQDHLNATNGKIIIYDLGAGRSKLILQTFLEFPNVTKIVGVELSTTRFEMGKTALLEYCSLQNKESEKQRSSCLTYKATSGDGKIEIVETNSETKQLRSLEARIQNLFETANEIDSADIVVCETVCSTFPPRSLQNSHFSPTVW